MSETTWPYTSHVWKLKMTEYIIKHSVMKNILLPFRHNGSIAFDYCTTAPLLCESTTSCNSVKSNWSNKQTLNTTKSVDFCSNSNRFKFNRFIGQMVSDHYLLLLPRTVGSNADFAWGDTHIWKKSVGMLFKCEGIYFSAIQNQYT